MRAILATEEDFAALLADGWVVSWGDHLGCYDSSPCPAGLTGVTAIASNQQADPREVPATKRLE